MDSHVGLDYIVDNPDYCTKLASALDTACTSVKKQVVELLSALCVYSQDGRQRAIDTLHIYQDRKGERYRLRVVVDELQKATAEDYQTALLAFINCLVISTPVLKDRVRIRNEFIGLKLLSILSDLRKEKSHVPDLRVQLDVFDDQRETDEELSNHGPPGIDLSSHVDVFYAILGQIADTPQEIPFLSILQHLLRLDPKEPASDLAWDTAETLVHRATLLENREDASKLLRSPSLQTNLCCHCRVADQTCGTNRKASVPTSSPPPPPPAPPVPAAPPPPSPPTSFALPPPPPPPLFIPIAPPDDPMEPPLPPPLHVPAVTRAPTPEPPSNNAKLLPQQEIPTPKTKMKTINWNKIPNHKVIGKRNIWALVANEHQNSPMADLDWAEMEGLFCQQMPPILPPTTCSSNFGTGVDAERRRREPTEIALLDGKRSLNVNIFLKQFRSSNEDIIQLIKDGGHDDIGAEKLRGLLKILPEVDELEMLKSFDGDKSKLGNAEKFFLQLIQVPNYKLRIECMLLKEEFAANMGYLAPSINSMILAGEDLMTNKPLQEVLYMVLVAGNFLNSGGYAGNAAGVKLSSLQKLTEIRANKPGMNLIHYVALQAERKRKDLLNFARGMNTLDSATKTTVEQLNNEFNCLDTKIKKIKSQIQLPSTEADIQDQMAQFLQMAEEEMAQLKSDMEELEGVRRTLAEFFCEDSNTFKIEECFRVFHHFCQKFNQAIAENERRRVQEEQVQARRKQREEQLLAKKRLLCNQAETPGSESECNLMDYGIFDIGMPQKHYSRSDAKIKRLQNGLVTSDEDISTTGSPSIRRRLGSCSGGPDQLSTKEDTYSPDITPNGTLRRRRSRIPCEDDDGNLMDFLRTTGQDNTRERKSWGSLDRSWAKRARGQPRRGDLLNADFSGDRERPNSPSPLVESKPFLQEEEAKPTGKAWRQKIEAWLSENEKEERAGEELQRKARQLQANRKDSGIFYFINYFYNYFVLLSNTFIFQIVIPSLLVLESEGKNSLANIPAEESSLHEGYTKSDVYDWRPSVEKTDVMRTMEAIEEAQPLSSQKDKSAWRKSSLNVPNSLEETDPRYSRRIRSRLSTENMLGSSTLQAIREEERKKNNKIPEIVSTEPLDELTIYLRQPVPVPQGPAKRRLSQLGKKNFEADTISDKIEIDSDNIETPPATRRLFSPPKDVKPVEKEPCKRERCSNSVQGREATKPGNSYADLGSGNFDRYSIARRTRRYKKNQDPVSEKLESALKQEGALKLEGPLIMEGSLKQEGPLQMETNSESYEVPPRRPSTLSLSDDINDSEAVLQVWQDKLKRRDVTNDIGAALAEIAKAEEDLQHISRSSAQRSTRLPVTQPAPVVAVTNTVLSPVMQESRPREAPMILAERAVSSRERRRSMIDPSQVKEAMRVMSDPPSQANIPEVVSPTRDLLSDPSDRPDGSILRDDSSRHFLDKSLNLNSDQGSPFNSEKPRSVSSIPKQNSMFKSRFIPDISVTSMPVNKARDQELNDEGFEETQSLVSETLSQETSSGNYETDTHDSTRCSPADLGCSTNDQRRGSDIPASEPSLTRIKSFERRNSSMRLKDEASSFLPKRSGSLKRDSPRKVEPVKRSEALTSRNPPRDEVERSGSRSSLRSSRSSLNSATSVNTVRNLGSNHAHLNRYTSAIRALTSDLRKGAGSPSNTAAKEAEKRRIAPRTGVSRIPASRSSSSGSSVGPALRNIRKSVGAITELPRGSSGNLKIRPVVSSRSSSSGSSVGPHPTTASRQSIDKLGTIGTLGTLGTSKSRIIQPRPSPRNHSFMRPTAASVNKGSIPNLPKSIKTLIK
ncbi:uncharacterized protein LOC117173991 isoform X2 [Belonocnema kinseyi]|uniref:uncharacterized protein LOC117173991 isoform X2 n=1 Tax=Belonocnema kinseyi TaxID=2817044 RepID=UPI00143D4E62|nr:uncharacterized protein LOC117173991 isoform X2 [Belonocnema kinseyi]